LLTMVCLALAGCEGNVATEQAPTAENAASPAPPAPAAPGVQPDAEGAPAAENAEAPAVESAAVPAAEAPGETPPAEEPAAEGTTEEAAAGVGVKGKDYGGPGFVTTPIEQYFRTGERIAFEVQIPNAMKLYKAAHDNKGPKTHEEFMEVIVKENGVSLPELPEGDEFLYDPKSEQLLVKHPAK
jgi:hypothetical protein